MAARPVWLIGCGNMAGAMLAGWLRAGEDPSRFHVIDPAGPELPAGVVHANAPPEPGFGPAIVQLGFKPQMLADIAPGLAPAIGRETIVTSIMAGVDLATLRGAFPEAAAIARTMPNLPVAHGLGAIGVLAEQGMATDDIVALLNPLGHVESVADDAAINAITVLSGSGPAFLFRFAEALANAGAEIGLDRDQALKLAVATVRGASQTAATSDESPAALAERVASPGGTTRAGLDVLDQGDALKRLVGRTLDAAMERAREMADETRG